MAGDWYECACGARYRSRTPALICCSNRIADVVEGGEATDA